MNVNDNPVLLRAVAQRLQALADENRLRLLMRLRTGECTVSLLARELDLAQPSVSKHLSVLREAGLVTVRRQGVGAFYAVADQSVFEMCHLVCDGVFRHMHQRRAELESAIGAVAAPGAPARRGTTRRRPARKKIVSPFNPE